MTRKKKGFFTFIFSLIPGAGEMYMGFMKQGLTLMGAVCLLILVATWMNAEGLLLALPLLWSYSFFHVHNLKNLPDEEFYAMEDDFLFHLDRVLPKGKDFGKTTRKVLAAILIIIGAKVLWDNLIDWLYWIIPDEWHMSGLIRDIPKSLIGIGLVVGGILLIRGKKKELDAVEKKEGEGNEN